jgi:C-terminal processing protease CtpA/Prc
MKNLLNFLIAVLLLASINVPARAQQREIKENFRAETIDSLLRLLKEKYAYPEMALKMEQEINAKSKRGEYDSISDGVKFAEKITADLRTVFDDKHLKLSYSVEPISVNTAKAGAPSAAEIERARRRQTREHFGAQRIEILKGNVGLIQLNYFAPLDWAADTYAAMMNFIADTDALILDLRQNTGSFDIDSAPFVSSYLFEKPVKVGEINWHETAETRQIWTSARVPGRKYLNKPVYVLTSRRTASGAEGFVSSLKNLKRATLVGETTMGATMPGMSHRVNEHFSVWISTGRSSSGSAANENKGTPPDIAVAPENALKAAHLQAVNQILQTTTDEDWKTQLKKIKTEIEDKN